MNDMLEMFPKDKHLAYLAGNWMMGQNSYEQAQKTLERGARHRQELSAGAE